MPLLVMILFPHVIYIFFCIFLCNLLRGTPNGFSGCSIPALLRYFSTTYLKNCGGGEGLRTTTCLKAVVGVSKVMLPVKYVCPNKASFVSIKFNGDNKAEVNLATHFWGYYWI